MAKRMKVVNPNRCFLDLYGLIYGLTPSNQLSQHSFLHFLTSAFSNMHSSMSRRRCGLLVSGILLGTLQQLSFNLAPVQQSGRLKLRDWEVEVSQGEGISAALSVHPMRWLEADERSSTSSD